MEVLLPKVFRKVTTLIIIFVLQALVAFSGVFCQEVFCAGMVDLNQYVSVTTANERSFLDRQTRILMSTADVTITNTSSKELIFPFYAVININGTDYGNVSMPDALGGLDTEPFGKYYYEWKETGASDIASNFGKDNCSGGCVGDFDRDGDVDGTDLAFACRGGKLKPGDSIRFRIRFERRAGINFTYNIQCFGSVTGGNQIPVAEAGNNRTVILPPDQSELTLTLDGSGSTDPDGTISSYTWTGTPDPEDVARPEVTLTEGTYVFTLVVADNNGAASAPDQVTITVKRPGGLQGHPPVLSVDSTRFSVDEGQTLSFNVSATDEDQEPVTITMWPKMDNSSFTVSRGLQASGTFTFSPDFSQQGIYQLLFTARDPEGYTDTKTVVITVNNVNRPPVFDPLTPQEVDEGRMLTVYVGVHDPDGEILTLTAENLPQNAIFIESTRTFTFLPDYSQSGEYEITFEATDSKDSSTATLHVTVNDVQGNGEPGTGLSLEVDNIESPTLLKRAQITGRVNVSGAPLPHLKSALITGLTPVQGKQGESLEITLYGSTEGDYATHFEQGVSHADFGPGITVYSLTVKSSTEAVAKITIEADAKEGPRSVTVSTNDERAISVVAFNVTPGTTSITGNLIDPDTGQPISGALVTVQGTGITTTTASDGSFELKDVPAGEHTLIINPENHRLISIPVNPSNGASVDLGNVESPAVVFDPNTAPSVSTFSVVSRGIGDVLGKKDIDELKRMVTDTMLAVGGTEAGVLDDYGNQLNPEIQGNGLVSLNPAGVRLIAQKLQRGGETVALGDLLFAFSFGLKWTGGTPMSLAEWIQMLQEQVNVAWLDPTRPENALAIVMFNRGKTISIEPPVLSPETRLNPMQAFLFASSLWTYVYSSQPGEAAADHNHETYFAKLKEVISNCAGGLYDLVVPSALADGDGIFKVPAGKYTRFWRNAFRAKTNFLTTTVQSAYRQLLTICTTMCIPIPDLTVMRMNVDANWPVVGAAMDNMVSALGTIRLASMVPEPPPADSIEANVITDDDGNKRVEISFAISESHKRSSFSAKGSRGYTYVYTLYRGSGSDRGLTKISQLVINPDTLVWVENPSKNKKELVPISWVAEGQGVYEWSSIRFTMVDQNPLPLVFTPDGSIAQAEYATWFYTVTLAKISNTSNSLSKQALNATIPWWNSTMMGLPSLGPLVSHSKHIMVSDYSAPVVVSIGSGEEINLSAIEVNPQNGDVFCLENDNHEIFRIEDNGNGPKVQFADVGFKTGANGLAIDREGAVYTENPASDDQFGGHIFKFEPPDSLNPEKLLVGSVNYFSRVLMFARPVSAGPIAIGKGSFGSLSPEDLYVVEKLSNKLNAVPVKGTFTSDPLRKFGRPWANIPFNAEPIDLEFDSIGDALLLVNHVGPATLTASLEVDKGIVSVDETFKVTLHLANPSSAAVNDVRPHIYLKEGQDRVTLISQPSEGGITLQPEESADFEYEYRAIKGGVVTIDGQGEGKDFTGVSISSLVVPPNGKQVVIGCPIVFEQVAAEPSRVSAGDIIHFKVRLRNEGSSTYTNITPRIDITRPLGEEVEQGEVSLVSGPTPASTSLAPGEVGEFQYTFEATGNGRVVFECTVTGVNGGTGNLDECGPAISNKVLISPLVVTLTADPKSVKFRETESSEVTLTVKNNGSTAVYNVVPDLSQLSSSGQFENWDLPDLTPVVLSGGETKTYVYRLSKPKSSGLVDLEATVNAETENGKTIPVDPARAVITIGPSISGHVYDVKIDGKDGLKKYIEGKDADKGIKLWVDDDYPLVTSRKIKAVPIIGGVRDESQMVESPINSDDGSYVLALPGPGTYELRLEGVEESNVGFTAIIRGVENENVTRDFYVPHSLVMTTLDLIKAYRHLTVPIGGIENLTGDLTTVKVSYYKLPESLENYLETFRRGEFSPPYEGLWEGADDEREVSDPSVQWDALIRLDAALVFTLRRFSEAGKIAVETVQDILPVIICEEVLKKRLKDSFEKYNLNLKWKRLTEKVEKRVATETLNLIKTCIDQYIKAFQNIYGAIKANNPNTAKQSIILTALNMAGKWVMYLESKVSAENISTSDMAYDVIVYTIVNAATRLYIDELFVKTHSEPVLLEAVDKASALKMEGSTETVLKDLVKLDGYIVKEIKNRNDIIKRVKDAKGVSSDFKGVLEAVEDWMKKVSNLGETYKPSDLFKVVSEGTKLADKLSGAIIAIRTADVMRTLFVDKPGEVCVAADQVFSATPDFMLDIPARYFVCTTGRRGK